MNQAIKLLICLIFLSDSFAQEEEEEDPIKLIELIGTPIEAILEYEGAEIRIKGFVENTRTNATGIHFLNFKGSSFECVTFSRQLPAFIDGPPVEIYKEKWIEVTGVIENYRGNPQIKLIDPSQVNVLDVSPPEPDPEPEMTEVTPEPVSPETEPDPKPEVPLENKTKDGRELEVVNGVPAIDWRLYFPE